MLLSQPSVAVITEHQSTKLWQILGQSGLENTVKILGLSLKMELKHWIFVSSAQFDGSKRIWPVTSLVSWGPENISSWQMRLWH